jgi:hypothetical protein
MSWCPSVFAVKWRDFDFIDKSGKTIVAKDKRINVKHIRDMEAAGRQARWRAG